MSAWLCVYCLPRVTHAAPEIVLDCAICFPCPLARSLFRLLAQVQSIVNQANYIVYPVLYLTCHTTSQVHPHRRACVGLQCYKRDWFYLCVRVLHIFPLDLILFFLYSFFSDRDAKKRWAHNVVSSNWSMGGLGGQMLTGVVKNSVGRVFGS